MRSPVACLAAVWLIACSTSTSSSTSSEPDGASGDDAGGEAADAAPSDAARPGPDAADAACTLLSPYSTKNATCNGCAQAACCAEVNGCLGDTACNDDYVNCILACALLPDDAGADAGAACEADCGARYPKGRAEYDTATGCVDKACASCR